MADEHSGNLNSEQIKTIVASVFFGVVMCFGYWKFFWKPFADKKADAAMKIAKIDSDIARAVGVTSKETSLSGEIAELSKLEADAEKRLPKDKRLPDLLRSLGSIGRSCHVNIASFTPQPQREQTYYIEVPYQVTVTGGFNDVGRFMAVLATSQRLFTVRDMNINAAQGGVNANFMLVSYQYKG
jgi:type IV pilus assembly protein PilO